MCFISMYSVLNTLLKYYFKHFCCLFPKITKAFSVSLSHFNLTWSFSADFKRFYCFFFTMRNCFILIFFSLWYWFNRVIVQSRCIVQSRFGSFLVFSGSLHILFAVPILESKSMGAIFQKKYLKILTKIYKIWKYFEKWHVIACDSYKQ